jgi:hypothetical protein
MGSIGGNVYVSVKGRQKKLEGEITFDPGGVTREQADDCNGESVGHTEKTRNGSCSLTFFLIDGLTWADIEAIVDQPASISCPSAGIKGRTDKLTCASCKEVNLAKGNAKADFFWPGRLI